MRSDADGAFADLLALRCPDRREEILGILPEARQQELREQLAKSFVLAPAELRARIAHRMVLATAARRERVVQAVGTMAFESLPPVLRRHLARRSAPRQPQ